MGNDYTKAVENQLAKSIKTEFPILTKDEAATAAGHIWQTDENWHEVDPAYPSGDVYRHREFHDRKYIKVFADMSSKKKDGGIFDPSTGNLVTVSWADMVSFCKKNPEKSGSKKQEEAGLDKEVKFRLIAVENVKYFRCGEVEYNVLSDVEQKLLDLI